MNLATKLDRFASVIDRINENVGKGISWLTTLLVLVICYDVTMRYIFNITFISVVELEWHLFAFIFLVGAGYAFKHERHVRVDVLYMRMNDKQKAWVNFLGTLLFLLPFCIITIYQSGQYALNSWAIAERSADPGGLPARYIVKSAIPIGFIFIFLQALALTARSLKTIIVPENQNPGHA